MKESDFKEVSLQSEATKIYIIHGSRFFKKIKAYSLGLGSDVLVRIVKICTSVGGISEQQKHIIGSPFPKFNSHYLQRCKDSNGYFPTLILIF